MILIVLLLSGSVWAQVVTASFDRTVLSKNPAASTTRGIGQVSVFADFKNSDSKINEKRSDGVDVPWKQNTEVSKTGIFFTGGGKAVIPELYLSFDKGDRILNLDLPNRTMNQEATNDVSFMNNLFNIGFRVSPTVGFGLKAYAPQYEYNESYAFDYLDGRKSSQVGRIKTNFLGVGAGLTYLLGANWYFGGYFVLNKEDRDARYVFKDIDGSIEIKDEVNQYTNSRFGLGLSYLNGRRGDGFRFEMAYNRMAHPDYLGVRDGEQFYSVMEYSAKIVTLGVNLKLKKSIYYEETDLIDMVLSEAAITRGFIPQVGTFISFGSDKGHAFGVSVLYYRSKGYTNIFGEEQRSKTTHRGFSGNYAYLF